MTRAILLLCALSACAPYADRVAATCARLGAPRGSPDYWPCVQQQIATDQADRAMWAGVAQTGLSIAAQPQPRPWVAQCRHVGGTTFCSGY